MPSQGPNFPGTVTAGGDWSNPSAASADDGAAADWDLGDAGESSELECSDFGFSIPLTATIVGYEVVIEANEQPLSGLGQVTIAHVQLFAGAATSDDKGDDQALTTAATQYTYGGAADDWNAGLSPADVNSSGFGVGIILEATSAVIAEVDFVTITVYYTEEGGGGEEAPLSQTMEIPLHVLFSSDDYVALPAGSRLTLEPSAMSTAV